MPCDCLFLSWFSDLVQASFITDPFRSAQCNPSNEYDGSFPHLLRSDAGAPCTHPRLDTNISVSTTNLSIAWTYPALTANDALLLATPVPALDTNLDFRSCNQLILGATAPPDIYLGFVVSIRENGEQANSPERRECYSSSELFDSSLGKFELTVEDLSPAKSYDFYIRPYRFEFVPPEGTLSFKFGIATKTVRIRTDDVAPTGSPQNVYVVSAGAREVTVAWDEIEDAIGDIVEYEVELLDPTSGLSEKHFSAVPTSIFRFVANAELHDDTQYMVRVRGRTLSPDFGPFSEWFNASTCPLNMALDIAQDDSCFSLIGYFAYRGQAVSCTTLPGQLLLDGGCDRNGIGVEEIPLGPGSWRPSLESLQVAKCPEEAFCGHSYQLSGVNQYCSPNHQGVYCFECLPGYALATEGCVLCDSSNLAQSDVVVGLGVLMFTLLLAAFSAKFYLVTGICGGSSREESKCEQQQSSKHKRRRTSVDEGCEEGNERRVVVDDEPQEVTVNRMEEECDEDNGTPVRVHGLTKMNHRGGEDGSDDNEDNQSSSHSTLSGRGRVPEESLHSMTRAGEFGSRMELIHSSIKSLLGAAEYTDTIPKTTLAVKLQIFFGFNQVIFAYGRILTTRAAPNSLAGVIGFFTYVDVSALFAEFKFRCVYNFNHYDDLVLRTLSPMLFIALLYLCKRMVARLRPGYDKTLQRTFVSSFLLVMFVIYPSVSQVIFETFWCEEFDTPLANVSGGTDLQETTNALKTDYRLSCANRDGWVAYALSMVVVYPVGVVFIYCYYLFRFKDIVRKRVKTVHDRQRLNKVTFLIEPYTVSCFWFEAYELVRKVMQTSFVGFFQEQHELMTFIAATLCIPAICVLVFFQPYKKQVDNVFALASLVVLAAAVQFSTEAKYQDAGVFVDVMLPAVYVEFSLFALAVVFDMVMYLWEIRSNKALAESIMP